MSQYIIVCPYKSVESGRKCSHIRATSSNRKGICREKVIEDCPMFKDWQEKINEMEVKQNDKSR